MAGFQEEFDDSSGDCAIARPSIVVAWLAAFLFLSFDEVKVINSRIFDKSFQNNVENIQ